MEEKESVDKPEPKPVKEKTLKLIVCKNCGLVMVNRTLDGKEEPWPCCQNCGYKQLNTNYMVKLA